METLNTIETLKSQVKEANTANTNDRQVIANASRDLYNIIEDGLCKKYGEDSINDAYKDLIEGNFAEPFICEKQKEKFNLYANIYIMKILQQ